MKVEDPRSPVVPPAPPAASESARPIAKRPEAPGADVVRLSSDLRLVDVAVRAAAMAGDVRPEAVASALALVARGDVGQDLERLADRIIDSLLDGHDDRN